MGIVRGGYLGGTMLVILGVVGGRVGSPSPLGSGERVCLG